MTMKSVKPVAPVERTKPLSLRANFSWTFIGNAIYAASQWGMLVVLAQLGTPEMVGLFALGLAVTAPVIMLSNLQLRAIQATDAKRDYAFAEYFGLRLVTTSLALAAIMGIAFTSYQGEVMTVIMLIGVAKAFEALSDIVYGLLQQRERMDRVAQSMMIKGPTSFAMLAFGVILTGSVSGGVAGIVLVWALLFAFYDLRSARLLVASTADLYPRWNVPRLRQLAWLALPLGLVMMLISLNSSIPRLFVERYLGESQLGIFAAMAYLLVAGNTVVGALGQSASPRLAQYYATENRRAYRRLLLQMVGIGAVLGAGGVLITAVAGQPILYFLYGPEYAAETDVFGWIMVAGMIANVNTFLGYGITSARVFRLQLVLSGLPVLLSFALSLLLIPSNHLIGGAWVLAGGHLVSVMLKSVTIMWIMQKSSAIAPLKGVR